MFCRLFEITQPHTLRRALIFVLHATRYVSIDTSRRQRGVATSRESLARLIAGLEKQGIRVIGLENVHLFHDARARETRSDEAIIF